MINFFPKQLPAISFALLLACNNSSSNIENNNVMKDSIAPKKTVSAATITPKITPCLWVEKDAQTVVDYYLSIFKDGKLKELHRYKNPPLENGQQGPDSFETAILDIGGLEFSILAAGPYFKYNESISFVINCKDQAEVDYYWEALTANGGAESACGWCKDKYGLSWQVVPVEYFELINSPDPKVRDKAMKNTLKQKKIILDELK